MNSPLWPGPDPVQVLVARAALIEVGRSDLAEHVHANRIGAPSLLPEHRGVGDGPVIGRAFLLGHRAAGHRAWPHGDGLRCPTCERLSEKARSSRCEE